MLIHNISSIYRYRNSFSSNNFTNTFNLEFWYHKPLNYLVSKKKTSTGKSIKQHPLRIFSGSDVDTLLWCLLKVVIFSHFWLECLLVFLFSEHSKAGLHLCKASFLQHFPIITSDDGTGKIKHWQHGIYRKNTPPSMGLNNDVKNKTKMKHNNYPT